jgi:hypothetical protein
MSEPDGLAGLRAWADIVARQADVLLRAPADAPAPAQAFDPIVEQLTTLEGLLPPTDPARAAVVPRLGILLAVRRTRRGGGPGDRDAALRHLRWAHREGTAADPLTVMARLALAELLGPDDPASGASLGDLFGNTAFFGAGTTSPATEERRRDAAELQDIFDRLDEGPIPPELRRRVDLARQALALLNTPDAARPRNILAGVRNLVEALPGGAPPPLRALLWMLTDGPAPTPAQAERELTAMGLDAPAHAPLRDTLTRVRTGRAAPAEGFHALGVLADTSPAPAPGGAAHDPDQARLWAYLRLMLGTLAPGSVRWDETDARAAAPRPGPGGGWSPRTGVERELAAFGDLLRARDGGLEHLERAAGHLRETIDATPGDHRAARTARSMLVGLLNSADVLAGNLQDMDAATAMTRALREEFARDPCGPLPADGFMHIRLTVVAAFQDLELAIRHDDPAAVPRVIDGLTGLYNGLPPDDELRFTVALALGAAHHYRAARSGDAEDLRAAHRFLREGAEARHAPPIFAAHLPTLRAAVLSSLVATDPDPASVDRAIAETEGVLAGPRLDHRMESELRHALGAGLLNRFARRPDRALVDRAVSELARAGELAAEGHGSVRASGALIRLSQAYARRAGLGGDRAGADVEAALRTGREALAEVAADVLLQLGAEHGLATARAGAAHALAMARWAAWHGRAADAVDVLELGRALVLQAAATSADVPALLCERGHPDLAEQWHAGVPADLLEPGAAGALPGRPSEPLIPSALRRRALAALGAGTGPGARALLGTPGTAELTAALTATGADALVYLVPGGDEDDFGLALLLTPGATAPTTLPLPLLTPGSAPLRQYFTAAAERSRRPTPGAERAWRRALGELCDWAWPAAMEPVLTALAAAPVHRVVLVPCGTLGAVAWHAARRPGGTGFRYACQDAVLSYAASGGQLLRAAARPRRPAADHQVLVADPALDLFWSSIEADALREACYPRALRYGEFPEHEADAAGTQEDLLAALPTASVVHVSCHALAGPRPTRSALRLADGGLTVAEILDRGAALPPGAGGPVVVLSACETDLSTQDHDEALTLSTALIARGAADVVGSRWAVDDGATALMMAVFHHFLSVRGDAPADALRAAQLWMLDPGRRPPPGLRDPLRREADHPGLDRVHLWAAFTHQGSPAQR